MFRILTRYPSSELAQLTLFPRVRKTGKTNFGLSFTRLGEHLIKHRFLQLNELVMLTLMKGDKVIEMENNRRYALLFAFRRVRDLNFSDVVAMDVYD